MIDINNLVNRILNEMPEDHRPEGYPAVQMQDLTALAEEIRRLRKVMEVCASMAGKDWLEGQLALAEALDAPYGTENLDVVLLRAAIDPIPYRPTGATR